MLKSPPAPVANDVKCHAITACHRGGKEKADSRAPGARSACRHCRETMPTSVWGTFTQFCRHHQQWFMSFNGPFIRIKVLLQVPFALSSKGDLHALGSNAAPVHFIGICSAVSSVGSCIASQVVKCPCCEAIQTMVPYVPRTACCEESSSLSLEQWEEDISGRTYIPVCTYPCSTLLKGLY